MSSPDVPSITWLLHKNEPHENVRLISFNNLLFFIHFRIQLHGNVASRPMMEMIDRLAVTFEIFVCVHVFFCVLAADSLVFVLSMLFYRLFITYMV